MHGADARDILHDGFGQPRDPGGYIEIEIQVERAETGEVDRFGKCEIDNEEKSSQKESVKVFAPKIYGASRCGNDLSDRSAFTERRCLDVHHAAAEGEER